MPPIKTKQLRSALLAKGFRESQGDHSFFVLYINGRKTSVRTKISHGASEYGDQLQGMVRKQLGRLSSQEFRDFVDCPLTADQYARLLQERGYVQV